MRKKTSAEQTAVVAYFERYAMARGHLPRVTVAMMRGLHGWPVHDVDARDGHGLVAHFPTEGEAEQAIRAGERHARPIIAKSKSNTALRTPFGSTR